MEDQSFHEAVFRKLGIPMQIILRGDKSVTNFIENLKKGKTTMCHASGMIIGCAGSGKTTLLERLKGIDLEEIKKNIRSTRGVDIHTDLFNVTESIQANSSRQQQHFKLRLDKKDVKQSVPNYHSENAADDGETQEKMKLEDDEGSTTEASSSGQISHDDIDINPTSSHEPQGATSPENVAEVMKERKDILHSPEFSGNLQIGAEDISEDPDKKITMTDFAGQCSYYASHQIFLSPRAFFILVLNMERKFDDKVGEDVCCQEGSVYGGWTHRDYLEFWIKSIHQYGSDKAPVILVGTHSENKTEKEKELFFREVWKTLDMKKKSLQKHIDVKRRFAVGFHDNESIEKLKLSIADVVCKLDHWGEELPQSWAMFETFFQEKKFRKILSRGELEMFNETLPEGIKLQISDMSPMLQFFHDIREIIHFNQQFLNGVIILDVQWFADAFRNVITDKNHAQEDLFEFASEWDKFNETGELDEALLSAIWRMNNNGYLEHKEDIMMYMEKLGLLAKMSDKTWYVPCMNKMQFPVDCFSSYPASSILCYTFDILPVEIFHRLVATCMQIPWEIFSDEERGCIYQTAAILVFHDQHHNILLGMTQTEIQVQVFVVDGKVDVSTCHQIRENIERILHNLSNTFQKNSDFQVAFKCKSTGFCDSRESAVIGKSKFIKDTFQCPSCPANKRHRIITEDITKYWEQNIESEKSTPNNKILDRFNTKYGNLNIRRLYFGTDHSTNTIVIAAVCDCDAQTIKKAKIRQFENHDVIIKRWKEATPETSKIEISEEANQWQLDHATAEKIEKEISENSKELMETHSNLEIISGSCVKSLKNGMKMLHKPCVVLYCSMKGIIPIEEKIFPTKIGDFPVDVREGFFFLSPNDKQFYQTSAEYDKLRMGCNIGTEGVMQTGSLGGFVDLKNEEIGFITCAHVLHNKLPISRENKNRSFRVVQPGYGKAMVNKICGEHVRSVCPYSKGPNAATVDAALVKVSRDRKPINGLFAELTPEHVDKRGFHPENPPTFSTGEIRDMRCPMQKEHRFQACFKVGSQTGFTRGSLHLNCTTVRLVSATLKRQPVSCPVYKLFEIKPESDHVFATQGDSGALVFQAVTSPPPERFVCIGMIIGIADNNFCYVMPIKEVLNELCLPEVESLYHFEVPMEVDGS